MPYTASNLRQLRHLFGYSQEYVAFRLNISQAAYSKWEAGLVRPGIHQLEVLAELYQLSIGDLLQENALELAKKAMVQPYTRMSL